MGYQGKMVEMDSQDEMVVMVYQDEMVEMDCQEAKEKRETLVCRDHGKPCSLSSFNRFECVDQSPESVPGSEADTDGALFYHTEVNCSHGIPCPPYNTQKKSRV